MLCKAPADGNEIADNIVLLVKSRREGQCLYYPTESGLPDNYQYPAIYVAENLGELYAIAEPDVKILSDGKENFTVEDRRN